MASKKNLCSKDINIYETVKKLCESLLKEEGAASLISVKSLIPIAYEALLNPATRLELDEDELCSAVLMVGSRTYRTGTISATDFEKLRTNIQKLKLYKNFLPCNPYDVVKILLLVHLDNAKARSTDESTKMASSSTDESTLMASSSRTLSVLAESNTSSLKNMSWEYFCSPKCESELPILSLDIPKDLFCDSSYSPFQKYTYVSRKYLHLHTISALVGTASMSYTKVLQSLDVREGLYTDGLDSESLGKMLEVVVKAGTSYLNLEFLSKLYYQAFWYASLDHFLTLYYMAAKELPSIYSILSWIQYITPLAEQIEFVESCVQLLPNLKLYLEKMFFITYKEFLFPNLPKLIHTFLFDGCEAYFKLIDDWIFEGRWHRELFFIQNKDSSNNIGSRESWTEAYLYIKDNAPDFLPCLEIYECGRNIVLLKICSQTDPLLEDLLSEYSHRPKIKPCANLMELKALKRSCEEYSSYINNLCGSKIEKFKGECFTSNSTSHPQLEAAAIKIPVSKIIDFPEENDVNHLVESEANLSPVIEDNNIAEERFYLNGQVLDCDSIENKVTKFREASKGHLQHETSDLGNRKQCELLLPAKSKQIKRSPLECDCKRFASSVLVDSPIVEDISSPAQNGNFKFNSSVGTEYVPELEQVDNLLSLNCSDLDNVSSVNNSFYSVNSKVDADIYMSIMSSPVDFVSLNGSVAHSPTDRKMLDSTLSQFSSTSCPDEEHTVGIAAKTNSSGLNEEINYCDFDNQEYLNNLPLKSAGIFRVDNHVVRKTVGDYKKYEDSSIASVKFKDDLMPLRLVIESSVWVPLQMQQKLVNDSLLRVFMNEHKFLLCTQALTKKFMLMDGVFSSRLINDLCNGIELYSPSQFLSCNKLSQILRYASSDSDNKVSFVVNSVPKQFCLNDPEVLSCLSLTYRIDWPLSFLITPLMIKKYNTVFSFLVSLERSFWKLKELFKILKFNSLYIKGSHFREMQLHRFIMTHYITTVKSYLQNAVIDANWNTFFKNVDKIKDLDSLYNMHVKFVKRVRVMCFLGNHTSKLLEEIMRLHKVILTYCSIALTGKWSFDDKNVFTHSKIAQLRHYFNSFVQLARFITAYVEKVVEHQDQSDFDGLLYLLTFNAFYLPQ